MMDGWKNKYEIINSQDVRAWVCVQLSFNVTVCMHRSFVKPSLFQSMWWVSPVDQTHLSSLLFLYTRLGSLPWPLCLPLPPFNAGLEHTHSDEDAFPMCCLYGSINRSVQGAAQYGCIIPHPKLQGLLFLGVIYLSVCLCVCVVSVWCLQGKKIVCRGQTVRVRLFYCNGPMVYVTLHTQCHHQIVKDNEVNLLAMSQPPLLFLNSNILLLHYDCQRNKV